MGRRVATLERPFDHVRSDEPVEHEEVAYDGSLLAIEGVPGLEGELHGRCIEPDVLEACGCVIAESTDHSSLSRDTHPRLPGVPANTSCSRIFRGTRMMERQPRTKASGRFLHDHGLVEVVEKVV